jgi:hypothetical protein
VYFDLLSAKIAAVCEYALNKTAKKSILFCENELFKQNQTEYENLLE